MDHDDLYGRVQGRVTELSASLIEVSHAIFDRPELRFEEHHAAAMLTEALENGGLEVTRGAFGLDTAFMAEAGSEGPIVAICCEYDALPSVGHACGHNIIAAAGLGAGLAAGALADELGGRVRVLGTPGEEGGGGKVMLAAAGAFDGVAAAAMIHPADADLLSMSTLAVSFVRATWHGRPAHAAAFPHLGRNALDAAVLGYQGVAALRQHLHPGERVHGIFVEGGEAANVVPERAVMEWMVRTPRLADLDALSNRVIACLEAGALATGCTLECREAGPIYADMVDNPVLSDRFAMHAAALGRTLGAPDACGHQVLGSTDMGNISHLVPSIHPMLKVAPFGVSIHSHDFAAHARSDAGDRAVLDGAQLLARLAVDLWTVPEILMATAEAFSREVTPH